MADERERAIERLQKKAAFRTHAIIYLAVNTGLVVIWAISDSGDGFWPIWSIGGWGIGLALHGFSAYRAPSGGITEEQIQQEIERGR